VPNTLLDRITRHMRHSTIWSCTAQHSTVWDHVVPNLLQSISIKKFWQYSMRLWQKQKTYRIIKFCSMLSTVRG